jgi:hypothetical protein
MTKRDEETGPGNRGFSLAKLESVASLKVLQNGTQLANSELMIKRYVQDNEVAATFYFYGEQIDCAATARKHTLESNCSCQAPYFCRHAVALVITFMELPGSFLDLQDFLDGLEDFSQEDLVTLLRTMVANYPAPALEAMGFPGFQPSEVLDEFDDDMFPGEIGDDLMGELDDDWDDDWDDDDAGGPGNEPVN